MTTPWSITDGDKALCRTNFVEAVRKNIPEPRNFFVLPSEDAHDAILIRNNWPSCRIIGVEQNSKVFAHIEATHLGVHPLNMTVGEYVDREVAFPSRQAFDAAFLDYTGPLTRPRLTEICKFVAFVTKPKAVVAITLQKTPRAKIEETRHLVVTQAWLEDADDDAVIFEDTNHWNKPEYLADAICRAIETGTGPVPSQREGLKRLDILDARSYRARDNSAYMHFMVLNVERA